MPASRYQATDENGQPGETAAAIRYRPARERAETAPCLSGGGFRATLFHLGALRRLNELGLLPRIDTITSVSGGSIMAAFLLPLAAFKRGSARRDAGPPLDIRLSDGGLYDKLGLEPIWKDHRTVLVWDGGSTFTSSGDGGLVQRLGRYIDIVDHQAAALRKRWLISSFLDDEMSGTYWGIGSATTSYENGKDGYPADFVDEVIAPVRAAPVVSSGAW